MKRKVSDSPCASYTFGAFGVGGFRFLNWYCSDFGGDQNTAS